jgi:hypothetical protein
VSIRPKDLRRGGRELGELVARKNVAYGSSFARAGEFLKLLYPDGIQPHQYTDALLLVRIFDKQMRIATAKRAFGESPYRDIAGYGLLGAAKDADRRGSDRRRK